MGGGRDGRVVAALLRAGRILREELERSVSEFGLGAVDLEVLRALELEGAMSAAELARCLGLRRQSVQEPLQRLVRAEVLVMERSNTDGRALSYSLTEEGRDRLSLGMAVLRGLEERFLSALPPLPAAELAELVERGAREAAREQIWTVFEAMR